MSARICLDIALLLIAVLILDYILNIFYIYLCVPKHMRDQNANVIVTFPTEVNIFGKAVKKYWSPEYRVCTPQQQMYYDRKYKRISFPENSGRIIIRWKD